jgi:hypothetical protein
MSTQAQEQTHQRPRELTAIVESYDTMVELMSKNEELQTRCDSQAHELSLVHAENGRLHKQNSQLQRSRDHYFRSHSAITAGIEDIAALFLEHIRKARNHDYGGRSPSHGSEIAKEVEEVSIPAFLREGPRMAPGPNNSRGPATLRVLAEALGGNRR